MSENNTAQNAKLGRSILIFLACAGLIVFAALTFLTLISYLISKFI